MTGAKQDKVFEQSRQRHLLTIGFLTTFKNNFDTATAFRLAAESFSTYMILYYQLVLKDTKPGSQQRFDTFRKHYIQYAKKTNYCLVIKCTPTALHVRYTRCPFAEIMKEYNLSAFSNAFCLSDPAFTKKILLALPFSGVM